MTIPFFPGKNRFYPILNIEYSNKISELKKCLDMWAECGINYYQLRAKDVQEEKYIKLAQKLHKYKPNMKIIANDFVCAAIEYRNIFSGLHIGQKDYAKLSKTIQEKLQIISLQNKNFVIGLSTHNAKQIQNALQMSINLSYIALGPCFITPSKNKKILLPLDKKIFTASLQVMCSAIQNKETDISFVFIGGIQKNTIVSLTQKLLCSSEKLYASSAIATIQAAKEKTSIYAIIKSFTAFEL